MPEPIPAPSAEERLHALFDAVRGFLDALEDEARAASALQVAMDNYSSSGPESRAHVRAMSAAVAARGRLVAMLPPRDPLHRGGLRQADPPR